LLRSQHAGGDVTAGDSSVSLDALLAEAAWLRALARSLVSDPSAADDVVQETWLAALRRPPLAGRPLRPWLRVVAENIVRMRRRGDGARDERERLSASTERTVAGVELVDRVEEQRFLAREVLKLDEPFRSALVLRYYEGLNSAQIAARTGSNENTVRWRLKRGLELLRESLDRRHGGDRREWMALLAPLCGASFGPDGSISVSAPTAASSSSGFLAALGLGVAGLVLTAWFFGRAPHESADERGDPAIATRVESADAAARRPDAQRTALDLRGGDLASPRTASLHGRAVDSTGATVEGAVVRLLGGDGLPIDAATSVKNGVFNVALGDARVVSPSGDVCVGASGFLERRVRAPFLRPGVFELGDVMLTREARIAGRVLDETGRPIVGAEVLLERIGSRWVSVREAPLEEARRLGSLLDASAPRARCDSEGRFELGGLEECFVRLWVNAEGFETQWTEPCALLAGETTAAPTVALPTIDLARCVVGRVLDEDGAPVAGAEIEAARSSLGRPFFEGRIGVVRTSSDADGAFRLALEPGGSYDLAARSADSAGMELGLVPGGVERIVRLRSRARWNVRWSLPRSGGQFGAHVELIVRDESTGALLGSAVERSDAPAAVLGCEVWRPFVIEARTGELAGRSAPIEPTSSPPSIFVPLEPMSSLKVSVVDRGGPRTDAEIDVLDARMPQRPWAEPVLFGAPLRLLVDAPLRPREQVRVDANGVARVRAFLGEPLVLRVRAPGRASVLLGPLAAYDGAVGVELDDGGALEGVVRRFDSEFVDGTCVAVSRGDGIAQQRIVGPDGAYRFDGLAPGGWQVRVIDSTRLADSSRASVTAMGAAAAADDVRIRAGLTTRFDLSVGATPRCVLAGELTLDGRVPGARIVELVRRGKQRVLARTHLGPRGRFELGVDDSGEFDLHIDSVGRGGESFELSEPVVLVDGSTRFAWAERSATLRVCAPGAASEVRVVAHCPTSRGGSLRVSRELDSTGCAELTVLASDVSIELDDGSVEPHELQLRAGERRELTLELR